jgi:hypothetical protein
VLAADLNVHEAGETREFIVVSCHLDFKDPLFIIYCKAGIVGEIFQEI